MLKNSLTLSSVSMCSGGHAISIVSDGTILTNVSLYVKRLPNSKAN